MEPLKPGQSYRCKQCGNKTRFTVRITRTVDYFHHQELGGTIIPEKEEQVIKEDVARVTCVWCQSTNIEVMEGLDTG
jgi:Zn finger protein HypA/HybF involved in hydrogenase expression